MRLIKYVVITALLLIPSKLYAQTHYCDTVNSTSGTGIVGVPELVQTCSDGKDVNGNAVTITSWALYDNSTTSVPITMTKGSTSTLSGKAVYTGSYTPVSAGNHTLTVTAISNGKESGKSNSFLLSASLPPAAPSTPTNLTVN